MEVVTLIADIVDSKEIQNRADFQKGLTEELKKLSNKKNIVSPYTITLGDEFQVIYKNTQSLFKDLFEILLFLFPIRIRVSIGIGTLDTDINHQNSLGMDGPAFHLARKGIEELKKLDVSMIQIYDSVNDTDLEFINRSLNLSLSEINRWKYNTFKIFIDLLNQKSVNEIYSSLKISQRGVYKIIKTNCIENYVDYFLCLDKKLRMRYPG